ncbi:hypothetical protein D3C80_2103950 [compost metagenome]
MIVGSGKNSPPLGIMMDNNPIRQKAINTHAEVCSPSVFENASIEKPKTKERTNTQKVGKLTGSNNINKTYR